MLNLEKTWTHGRTWFQECQTNLFPKTRKLSSIFDDWQTCRQGVDRYMSSSTLVENPCFMSFLSQAYRQDRISLAELHADAAMMTFAGSETTAFTLIVALFYLGHQPKAQARLFDEIHGLYNDTGSLEHRDLAKSAEYLNAVLQESMRLFPAVPGPLKRVSIQDEMVAGVFVPAGTIVSASTFSMNRDERYFEMPGMCANVLSNTSLIVQDLFIPERWLQNASCNSHISQPFGIGTRACIARP